MSGRAALWLAAAALLVAGGYVFLAALRGGSPLLYFGAAVLFGMAIAALQRAARRGG